MKKDSKEKVVEKKAPEKKEKKKKVVKSKKTKPAKVVVKKPNIFKRIGGWFGNVYREVSKVKWISKKEMVKYSVATIAFVIFFAVFFYAIEIGMAWLKTLVV